MTSISPSRNTSERIFSALKHTTIDDETTNKMNMPTATQRSLEDETMKTITKNFSCLFKWPLIKINAPEDINIKKLNDDELINLTDEDALFHLLELGARAAGGQPH